MPTKDFYSEDNKQGGKMHDTGSQCQFEGGLLEILVTQEKKNVAVIL